MAQYLTSRRLAKQFIEVALAMVCRYLFATIQKSLARRR
jgi:hypothetical protein